MKNKLLVGIIALIALATTTPALATQTCAGNISTVSGGDTYGTWNSTFFWEIGVILNDSAVNNTTSALLQTNWTGTMTNYTMHNESDAVNFTYNITGMPAASGGYIHFKVIYQNSSGANATCLSDMKFKINQSTATGAITGYDESGTSVTTLEAPARIRPDCVLTNDDVSTETVLPIVQLSVAYPATSGVGTVGLPDNTETTLPAVGAGNAVYTFACTYSADENYTTGTDGSLTFTVTPPGSPIIVGTESVAGEPVVIGNINITEIVTQYWWAILIVAAIILWKKKKL